MCFGVYISNSPGCNVCPGPDHGAKHVYSEKNVGMFVFWAPPEARPGAGPGEAAYSKKKLECLCSGLRPRRDPGLGQAKPCIFEGLECLLFWAPPEARPGVGPGEAAYSKKKFGMFMFWAPPEARPVARSEARPGAKSVYSKKKL